MKTKVTEVCKGFPSIADVRALSGCFMVRWLLPGMAGVRHSDWSYAYLDGTEADALHLAAALARFPQRVQVWDMSEHNVCLRYDFNVTVSV